jgi:hypothetical protein
MPYVPGFPSVLFHEVWHLPSAFVLQKLVKDFKGSVDHHRLPRGKIGEDTTQDTHRLTQRMQVVIPFGCGKVQFEMLTLENEGEKIFLLSEPLEECLDAVTRVKLLTLFLDLCDGRVDPSSYGKNVPLTTRLQTLEKRVQEQKVLLLSLQ